MAMELPTTSATMKNGVTTKSAAELAAELHISLRAIRTQQFPKLDHNSGRLSSTDSHKDNGGSPSYSSGSSSSPSASPPPSSSNRRRSSSSRVKPTLPSSSVSTSSITTTGGLPVISPACDRCRRLKTKCERRHQPDQPCSRCIKAGLECTLEDTLLLPGPPKRSQKQIFEEFGVPYQSFRAAINEQRRRSLEQHLQRQQTSSRLEQRLSQSARRASSSSRPAKASSRHSFSKASRKQRVNHNVSTNSEAEDNEHAIDSDSTSGSTTTPSKPCLRVSTRVASQSVPAVANVDPLASMFSSSSSSSSASPTALSASASPEIPFLHATAGAVLPSSAPASLKLLSPINLPGSTLPTSTSTVASSSTVPPFNDGVFPDSFWAMATQAPASTFPATSMNPAVSIPNFTPATTAVPTPFSLINDGNGNGSAFPDSANQLYSTSAPATHSIPHLTQHNGINPINNEPSFWPNDSWASHARFDSAASSTSVSSSSSAVSALAAPPSAAAVNAVPYRGGAPQGEGNTPASAAAAALAAAAFHLHGNASMRPHHRQYSSSPSIPSLSSTSSTSSSTPSPVSATSSLRAPTGFATALAAQHAKTAPAKPRTSQFALITSMTSQLEVDDDGDSLFDEDGEQDEELEEQEGLEEEEEELLEDQDQYDEDNLATPCAASFSDVYHLHGAHHQQQQQQQQQQQSFPSVEAMMNMMMQQSSSVSSSSFTPSSTVESASLPTGLPMHMPFVPSMGMDVEMDLARSTSTTAEFVNSLASATQHDNDPTTFLYDTQRS